MAQIIDKLAWIQIVDKRTLSTRSKGKTIYYLPGGKREHGETDHACLVREIKEELDVDLIPETLNFVGTFEAQAHGHSEGIIVKMTCYSGNYQGTLHASAEIEELLWLAYADKAKSSQVDQIIFDWLKKHDLIN
ncbi:NUDIX hydrolase [Herpetosiphon llansteffanensis]